MASIFDKDNPDGIFPVLARLETRLGLPAQFCETFRAEDDWSFIIKLHALLEAALTGALVSKLGHAELERVLSNLPTSSAEIGKVEFALALGLIRSDERRCIKCLSRLRNDVAHSIRNVSFDLKRYVDALDPDKKKEFVRDVAEWGGVTRSAVLTRFVLEEPKTVLWHSGLILSAVLFMQGESSELERQNIALVLDSLRALREINDLRPPGEDQQ
jgi:hypothetical protein